MSAILSTIQVAKPWGRDKLPDPFSAPDGERIGEIWFEPPETLPELFVKFIFTSEKLSVQVHPDDEQAEAAGLGRRGKSECWYVIDAEPGATLGIGFAETISAEIMRTAALDGSIEDRLVWHPVRPGDFYYIPANTVHAIGPGVSLIEVQQNSDVTYRLYDYGRPRALHLDAGLKVARGKPYDKALFRHVPARGTRRLVDGPPFVVDRVEGPIPARNARDYRGSLLVIPRTPGIRVAGVDVAVGQCALAGTIAEVEVVARALCLLASPR